MNSNILRELKGGIPLLTEYQLRFLDDVKSVVEKEFRTDESVFCQSLTLESRRYDEEKIAEFHDNVRVIEENLEIIINRLKGGRNEREKFLNTYPKWKKVREDAIEKLRGIAVSMQRDRSIYNVSKLAGLITSFVGGGVMLASDNPFAFELTSPLSISAAGLFAVAAASIIQPVLLKNKVNAAKEVIKEDKKYFQEMNNWLKHAAEIEEALSEISEIYVVKDIFENIQSLVKDGMNIRDAFKRLDYITDAINSLKFFLPASITEAVPLIEKVKFISYLVALFLLMWKSENRFVFDLASLTIRSIVVSLRDNYFGVERLTTLFTGNAVLAKDLAKAVSRETFAVLGMGLDGAEIGLTLIDIHKGSQSPEAEKISKASDKLEEEAKLLNNIYKNISN